MLDLTEEAVEAIRDIVEESEVGPDGGLRISGVERGNGDTALEFELAAERRSKATRSSREGGAVVFLDADRGRGARGQDARRARARRPLSLLARRARRALS